MKSSANHLRNRGSEPAPGELGRLESHKALLEEYLSGLIFSEDPRLEGLVGAMRHALLAGGDRIRPILCMEVAESFGLAPIEVLPSAAAVELIYTISLVHSDLPEMGDESSRRTSGEACHERFGEATAILAGDGFFGESLALITSNQRGTPCQLVEIVRELARSTGVEGMVGAQALGVAHPQNAEALILSRSKTTTLIEASARIGAILAGATPDEKRKVSEYGHEIGLLLTADAPSWADPRAPEEAVDGDGGGGIPSDEARRLLKARRHPGDEALERVLAALKGLRRDTAGLAGLAAFVRYGASPLRPKRTADTGNRPIGGERS